MSTSKPAQPVAGIFWMMMTGFSFVAVTAIVKAMGSDLPPTVMAFVRYVLGLVFLVPMLKALDLGEITRRQWRLFGLRGAFHAAGVCLWFYAMTRIPIAEVTAMNYLAPVYVSVGAALFLGERFALRRMLAVAAALVGAVIILRPGFREITSGHWAMLLAGGVFAGSYLLAKILADETPASLVVAMLSIVVPVCLLPLAIADWVTPSLADLALLFLVACFATAGHYTMTLAFAAAPVTVTQPVTFLQLVWAMLLGAFVFAEPLDVWVVLGGAVILSAVSYITWREAVLRKRPVTPPAPATKS